MFTFPIMAVRRIMRAEKRMPPPMAASAIHTMACVLARRAARFLARRRPGVYILSNGKLADGQKPLVVYSAECHPTGNPDWWEYKRQHFGGDDGVEFIEANLLLPSFDRKPIATHLGIQLSENEISFSLITQ